MSIKRILIVDDSPTERHVLNDMLTKAGYTSWEGMKAKGAAAYSIVRGTVIAKEGKLEGKAGYGQFVPGTAAA